MNSSQLDHIAEQLWNAEAEGAPVPPVRGAIADAAAGGSAIFAAYQVQQIITRRKLDAGARLVGRKIGLTSPAVQKQLGVGEPDYGALFDSMAVCDGEEISLARLMQPKAEAEIAFVLKKDLAFACNTVADIVGAIDYAVAAIEVVGSRIANWDIRLEDTVADNASSAMFVLGTRPVALSRLDLAGCKMVMKVHDEAVSKGAGSACLGNPLNAMRWLANTMSRLGTPLRAGDVVLSGALGPMVAVAGPTTFTAEIEGLGSVRAIFE
jgi:2-keto-4-pentenoate hydratase